MPSLLDQLNEALAAFSGLRTPPALIGGLALAVHDVVRATRDVDFLVDADDADRVHGLLLELGYHCVHRSADAANYLRGEEGLDLIYAHRPVARNLLATAVERDTAMGRLRVISVPITKPSTSMHLPDTSGCSIARTCWMSSSAKPVADRRTVVLVKEGGVRRMPPSADPVKAWLDLMEVVRMLRPAGQPRPPKPPRRGPFLL